jgi:hypothetical protein
MYEKTITAKVELITPEIAAEWLKKNDHNRKLTQSNVKKIEHALLNDEWQVSGQSIIIAWDGSVMDGQHRLEGVVNTGISMWNLVCRGVDPKVFSVIDTGKARNGADTLSISGVGDSTKIASLVKLYEGYKTKTLHNPPRLSNTEILKLYEANPNMYHLALEDGVLYRTANTLSDIQWALLILAMKDVVKGEEYIQELLKGETNEALASVHKAIGLARKQGGGRLATSRVWVAVFAGYKYFVRGTTVPTRLETKKAVNGKDKALDIPYPHDL